jgi:hypothetical protein
MDDEKGIEMRIEDAKATVEPVHTVSRRAIGCVLGACFAIFAAVFGVTSTGVYAASIGAGAGNASETPWFSNTAQVRPFFSSAAPRLTPRCRLADLPSHPRTTRLPEC